MEPSTKRQKINNKTYRNIRRNNNTIRKSVQIINYPTNIKNTYSKNEYERANLEQLAKNMKTGRIAVAYGKAAAYMQGRPVEPNNIAEPSPIPRNTVMNILSKIRQNKTAKRKQILNKVRRNNTSKN